MTPSRAILSQKESNDMFLGLDEIKSLNTSFLLILSKRMECWTWDTQIADIFIPFVCI